jgi:hypothetical protein
VRGAPDPRASGDDPVRAVAETEQMHLASVRSLEQRPSPELYVWTVSGAVGGEQTAPLTCHVPQAVKRQLGGAPLEPRRVGVPLGGSRSVSL